MSRFSPAPYVAGARELVRVFWQLGRTAEPQCTLLYGAKVLARIGTVLRQRTLLQADYAMRGRYWKFTVSGTPLLLNGSAFFVIREICAENVYLPLPELQIHLGETVIDLGANVGVFTTLAAKKGATVVAVEAQAKLIPEIDHHLGLNQCAERVRVEWALVGAASGLFRDVANLRSDPSFDGEPPRRTMWEIIRRNHLSIVDLLKIDIEGSEFDLLERDNDWLGCVRRITMEVHPAFGRVPRLVQVLVHYGFEVHVRNNALRTVPSHDPSACYIYALKP